MNNGHLLTTASIIHQRPVRISLLSDTSFQRPLFSGPKGGRCKQVWLYIGTCYIFIFFVSGEHLDMLDEIEEKLKKKRAKERKEKMSKKWNLNFDFVFVVLFLRTKSLQGTRKVEYFWLGLELVVCFRKLFVPVSYDASEMLNQKSEKQKKVSQS